ncbi:MAG: hypothetical protein GXO35_07610 [Gammaproteobacteria bacterium]|nr:hypothetical protein [Gammaproteobacteria bacterium]
MALTQDRNTASQKANAIVIAMAAGAYIHAGALVVASATGFAEAGSTATGLTYLGRAEEAVDNTSGIDGATEITIMRKRAFQFKNDGSITQVNFGKECYIVDDETLAATDGAGTRSAAGIVVGIDSDGVWVE